MIWKQVRAENFLSWRKLDLSLEIQRPTLILGENQDNAGASSNGAGKSSVFDAMLWTLFGKTLRGLSGADVIREGAEETTTEVLWDDYQVRRSRKGEEIRLDLFRGKKDLSSLTPTITQKRIELAFGFDYESFVAAAIFGQDVTRWITYTDKGRKGILERLIGTEQLERVLKEIRALRQGSNISVGLSQNSLHSLEEEQKQAEIRLQELAKEEEDWRASLTQRSDLLTKTLEEAQAQQTSLQEQAKQMATELVQQEEAAKTTERQIKDRLEWERVEERRQDQLEAIERQLQDLDNEQAELGILSEGDPCPACERPLENASLLKVNNSNKEGIDRIERDRAEAQASLGKLKIPVPEAFKPPEGALDLYQETNRKLASLRDQSHQAEQRIQTTMREIDQLVAKEGSFEASRAEVQRGITEKIKRIQTLKEELDANHRDHLCLEWLERAFGPNGIRSYLLDGALPRFQDWANQILACIGPNLRVQLSTQTVLKSGESREKLDCLVTMDARQTSYEALSAGEKQRIDVAFALALQSLAAERSPIGLAVFDEIFERLDAEGCERVAQLLRLRFKGQGCWVITHNDFLKSAFQDVILVQKVGGISRIAREKRASEGKELVGNPVSGAKSK